MQEIAPAEYRAYRDFVVSQNSEAVERYGSRLAEMGYYLTDNQIMDEIAADYTGKILKDADSINHFMDNAENGKLNTKMSVSENMTIAQKLWQSVRDFIDKVKSVFKGDKNAQNRESRKAYGKNMAELEKAEQLLRNAYTAAAERTKNNRNEKSEYVDLGNGVKYSVNTSFEEQVDKWLAGEMKSDECFKLGITSGALSKMKFGQLPIIMTKKIMKKITGGKHLLTINEVKKIPQNLNNPVAIFKSATMDKAYVVLTEMKEGKDTVLIALHMDQAYKHINVNKIASVYGKKNINNFIQNQLAIGNLLYADKKISIGRKA